MTAGVEQAEIALDLLAKLTAAQHESDGYRAQRDFYHEAADALAEQLADARKQLQDRKPQ